MMPAHTKGQRGLALGDTGKLLPNHYAKIAGLVQKNLHGQRLAADFLDAIRTGKYVDPDSIFETIREIENDAELRGFCRILQKRIEQRRAYA